MAMTEKERQELADLVLKMLEAEKKRKAAQLEALAERNLKIGMLVQMDNETIGTAFRCFVDNLRYWEAQELHGQTLEAYSLICDIFYLEMLEC